MLRAVGKARLNAGIVFSNHAVERMLERRITVKEVIRNDPRIKVIKEGSTIVTTYPNTEV